MWHHLNLAIYLCNIILIFFIINKCNLFVNKNYSSFTIESNFLCSGFLCFLSNISSVSNTFNTDITLRHVFTKAFCVAHTWQCLVWRWGALAGQGSLPAVHPLIIWKWLHWQGSALRKNTPGSSPLVAAPGTYSPPDTTWPPGLYTAAKMRRKVKHYMCYNQC